MVAVESQSLTPESFQKATELRKQLDVVLMQDPKFLEKAGQAVLHPQSNGDTTRGFLYKVSWERKDGKHIIVTAKNLGGEESLHVDMYSGQSLKRATITTNETNATGRLSYDEAHISGILISISRDISETTTGIKGIINDLEK